MTCQKSSHVSDIIDIRLLGGINDSFLIGALNNIHFYFTKSGFLIFSWKQSHYGGLVCGITVSPDQELKLLEPHGSLVLFHLPERVFLGILYWIFGSIYCKHSNYDRLCQPFHIPRIHSNISHSTALKDSLCELKGSPVPECLLH